MKLREAKVVVVGAGGLGCPALQYLAAAGIGTLGIVDHDVVDLSNLQRQILHREKRIGELKAESAASAIREINSSIIAQVHPVTLTSLNARDILSQYDVILDCTDNAPVRYLLSDSAVALGKPLVSGAAMKYDGQLCTYNLQPNGPCYRCIFPKPPAPELIGSCEDSGILGAVTGIVGTLQALQTIKLITGQHEQNASLLLFSALGMPPFRSVRLRQKRENCPACGASDGRAGAIEETDYVAFCGGNQPNWEARGLLPGPTGSRMTPFEVQTALSHAQWTILDVRSRAEFSICHLKDSINIPLQELAHDIPPTLPLGPVVVVCRLGNDSQIAASRLREARSDGENERIIVDMIGGLREWSKGVDPLFPVY